MKVLHVFMVLLYGLSCEVSAQRESPSFASSGQIQLPEQFVLSIDGQDMTSQVIRDKVIIIKTENKWMDLHLPERSAEDTLQYRIEPYDERWLPFPLGPFRLGELPEGKYELLIQNASTQELICSLPVQIKGGVFYGIRGYLIVFTILGLSLVIFFWVRSMFLRRDKNRTVQYLENTVMRRTNQLQELVHQREMLLKEIHHRVKNNLQVISALLEMQSARTKDENVKAAITEGQNRVLSIAFIHQNLYQHDDLKGVEIDSFLKELTSHIRQVFQRADCPVEVVTEVPRFHLDIDSAIPLGLLINELITNAYKYAFAGRSSGKIMIVIEDIGEGNYTFVFHDNGVGLPENFDFSRTNTLGMKLIRQLSRQLAGNIVYRYEDGSKFELKFKNLEARSKLL